MREVPIGEVERFRNAASSFTDWLCTNKFQYAPNDDVNLRIACRQSVNWIVYESLWEQLWNEGWFMDGVTAFALNALEGDGWIKTLVDDQGCINICLRDGRMFSLQDFVAGESLADLKYDPEFADLDWQPVCAMGHILAEYESITGE